MKFFLSRAGRWFPHAISLLFLAGGAIAFRADLARLSFAAVRTAPEAIALAALLSLCNYALRSGRWAVYLARLGGRFPLGFVGLTYVAGFAYTLSPGKLGEMMRARYYQARGLGLSATAAAFFVERLLDLLAMASLALLAFAATSVYSALLWAVVAAIAALLVTLGTVPWGRLRGWLECHPVIPARLRGPLLGLACTLASARGLLRPGPLAFGFLLGLCAWGAEGVGLSVLGALAPSVPLDWAGATGIYSVAIIVGALSFLPGGLGSTEGVMAALLTARGFELADALLLTLGCRLLTLWFAVILGWVAVFLLRLRGPLPACP